MSRDLSSEKIVELIGAVFINEQLSSDFLIFDRGLDDNVRQSHQYRKKYIEEVYRGRYSCHSIDFI